MTRFRMRNVILPAVLVSSGVFSVLTLPFVLNKSETTSFATPSFLENPPQFVMDRADRNAAIRYVGGAIVVSVGAGIATIEILRRLHPANRLSKVQKDVLNSKIRQLEAEGQSDSNLLTESVETTISSFLVEEETAEMELKHRSIGLPKSAEDNKRQSRLGDLLEETQSTGQLSSAPRSIDRDQLFADEASRTSLLAQQQDVNWANPAQPDPPPLSYEAYRIKVPHRQQTLFAILLNGQYYSLVRTHKNREKVLEIAANLRQLGEEVVVTPVEERYAVWLLQPEAYLEWVS